jgi:hypothetical protein
MIQTLRPMTTSELLDRSFYYYRRHFTLLVGIFAISGLVTLLFQILLLLTPRATAGVFLASILALGGFVVSLVVTTLAHGTTIVAVSQILLGRETSVAQAFNEVRHRVGELILLGMNIGARVLIGFVLFIVPGVWLALHYAVSIQAAVLEHTGINESLARSATLTKGDKGRIFVIYFLFGVLTMIVSVLVTLVTGALTGFPRLGSAGQDVLWRSMVLQFGSFGAQAILGPLLPIALILVYYDERVRKEAFDIEHMMHQLDGATPESLAT